MAKHTKRLPPWLLGMIIAAVVSLAALYLIFALGFGDDPVVENLGLILSD